MSASSTPSVTVIPLNIAPALNVLQRSSSIPLKDTVTVFGSVARRLQLISLDDRILPSSPFATPFTKTNEYTFKVTWEITYA